MNAPQSRAGTHPAPATPTAAHQTAHDALRAGNGGVVEPPPPYRSDRWRGTWQPPPIPPSDVARIRNAAHHARTVLPDELGLLVHDTIKDWCEGGQRFGGHARMLRVADILHDWQTAHALGRTYP